MTRIIDKRGDAAGDEDLVTLRVFQTSEGDVRAGVLSGDPAADGATMCKLGWPASKAFLDMLSLCEKENMRFLLIDDPLGLFPPQDRLMRET